MKFNIGIFFAQRDIFGFGFLHPVFTENSLSSSEGGPYGKLIMCLADGDKGRIGEADRALIAASSITLELKSWQAAYRNRLAIAAWSLR